MFQTPDCYLWMLGVRLLELVATSKLSVQTGVIRQTGLLTILARQVHGGSSRRGMELQAVLDRLEQFAPTRNHLIPHHTHLAS